MNEGMTPDAGIALSSEPQVGAAGMSPQSTIKRDPPTPPEQRAAFINDWCGRIRAAKKHWEPDFKRMRENMEFVRLGADKEWCEADKYVANITQQHINQKVAALYARNPKFVCKRRERMDFTIWDEKPESIQMAMQQAQANPAMLPMYQMLMQDVEQGVSRRQQIERICKTMELLFADCVKEQQPNFKKAMKQLIRRVLITGLGWVKIDFQRVMQPRPDEEAQVNDITHRVAHLERLQSDKIDGKITESQGENEELAQATARIQSEPEVIAREGMVFSFPRSTAIIPDPAIRSLDGLQGADWVVEEFLLSNDEIKEIYKIDIGTEARAYTEKGVENGQISLPFGTNGSGYAAKSYSMVWHVYHKKTGMFFVIADGYKDYLKAPSQPPVTLETFFPYVALLFNELEHDKQVYPLADVDRLRHIQKEYNRSKEALRQHRIASAPLYVTGAGQFDEEDQLNLALHAPHDVVVLKGLNEGENVNNKLQQVEKKAIDPNVYETESLLLDMTRVVGTQEAHLGSTSGATATETSVAEDSRVSALSANTDDLDEFLSELARLGGQVLLLEMSVDEVKKRVGQGAVWPELTRAEVMEELAISIEAGSSGRPNKAAKGAALERVGNILLSLPGVSPRWLFKQLMLTVDETLDLTDAFVEGQPSILTMNKLATAAQATPVDGVNDPTNQGAEGGQNDVNAPQNGGTAKPAYTAPGTAKNQFVS